MDQMGSSSAHASQGQSGIKRLPQTIEGATERYLNSYEDCFMGSAADMYRLRNLARQFIYKLRQIAPKFYEERLPQLVNQAASHLLACDRTTKEGLKKFHETHAYFLLILQDLQQSQPAGEINFQNEKDRFQERAHLIKLQSNLAKKISELEAAEFDYDDLGDDDYESAYEKTFSELEQLRIEQREVNLQLAYIEGEQIEDKVEFKLRVKPNSILNRLTRDQLEDLERQMLLFYKQNNQRKTAIYLDKSIIDGMIDNLGIDKSKFQIEEMRHISKDALDAYKSYYREKEQAVRNEFHEILLKNEHLRPKEGFILDDPDCLPEDVKKRLDLNLSRFQQETEVLVEEYSNKQDTEQAIEDQIGEESDDEGACKFPNEEILTSLRAKGVDFARVCETPRDDYMQSDGGEDDDR